MNPATPANDAPHFADRLVAAIDRAGAPLCVGLDPVLEKIPAECTGFDAPRRVAAFSVGVIEAVAGLACAVKFQSACYERLGIPGIAALEFAMQRARAAGLLVILDAKRGDIGISAEHYAAAAFGAQRADALTVSPYLGPDTLEPFIADQSRGVFVLVRTSNPGSDRVQSQRLADGRTVAEMIADQVAALARTRVGSRHLSSVGAVVGATKAADAAALRARMPDSVFLVPGYGAQGGTADDLRAMRRPGGRTPAECGVLVTASRSIIYPAREGGATWENAVRMAAERTIQELHGVFH